LLKWDEELNDETRMGEDAFRCALAINPTDKRFWKATVTDGFYVCNGAAQYDVSTVTLWGDYSSQATADNIC